MLYSFRRFNNAVVFIFIMIFAAVSTDLYADEDRRKIEEYNVMCTAVCTVINTALYGNIRSWQDFLNALTFGALSGYGFYRGKDLIGKDRVQEGMILTYLSSSVVENVSIGENPLAYVRYGAGPFGLKFATPFANRPKYWITAELDVFPALPAFAAFLKESKQIKFKDGIFYSVKSHRKMVDMYDDTDIVPAGFASERYIILDEYYENNESVWRHESIHVAQSIQLGSFFSKNWQMMQYDNSYGNGCRSFCFRDEEDCETEIFGVDYRMGMFGAVLDRIDYSQGYTDRWSEIEAYELDIDTSIEEWREYEKYWN